MADPVASRRTSFDAMPHDDWSDLAAVIPLPWPRSASAHDLRWYAAEHAIRGVKLPSVRDLAERWGWTRTRVHDLIADFGAWADAARPWGWRAKDEPRKIRTVDGQSTDNGRTDGGQPERLEADNRQDSGHATDSGRTADGQPADSRAFLTGSPPTDHPTPDTRERASSAPAAAPTATPLVLSDAWAKHLPTDTTTTADAPAPVKARPVKRTSRTTPDTHAREVVAGWCDAYRDATGATYAITGADAGKLRRAAADYATGEAWADGVERLTRGMATYIRDPKRFPPGPPTVTGFLIDPQRWIAIAESASPAANGPPTDTTPARTRHNPF